MATSYIINNALDPRNRDWEDLPCGNWLFEDQDLPIHANLPIYAKVQSCLRGKCHCLGDAETKLEETREPMAC